MKDSLVEQVRNLLQTMPDTLSVESLERRRPEIMKISEACKKTPFYRRTEKQRFEFYRPIGKVPREKALLMCWVQFLDRMANVPSPRYMEGVIILCFPIIGDILKYGEFKHRG